jgi:hypothetical protein
MSKRKVLLIAALFFPILGMYAGMASAAAIGNATYGLYSETYDGIIYDSNVAEGGHMGTWPGGYPLGPLLLSDTTTFREGGTSLKVVVPNGLSCGMWMQFGSDASANPQFPKVQTNMSSYIGGTIDFDVRTNSDLQVKIEWGASGSASVNLSNYAAINNIWQHVSIPLSAFVGINYSQITIPAGFHSVQIVSGRRYWIDNVVWRKSTEGTLDVTLKKVSDGSTVTGTAITWTNPHPGVDRWKTADQYMELKLTYFNAAGCGIQIYTDNKNPAAVPRFDGASDPAGLIDVSSTSHKVPLCWRIVDVTTTTHIMQGADNFPDRLWENQLTDQYPCYIWMKDRQSSDFADGMDYATAWDYRGIQHGETTFGAAKSPNYVYFGADFSHAVGSRTYETGKLIVELYSE